jgi:flagellar protein FliJ
MPQFRALQLAITLATRQRDALAQKHAQAQRTLDFARGQMDQLQSYAGETDARWMRHGQVSVAPELMHHHYQFMDRLQHAVRLQEGVLANLEKQLQSTHQALLQAEVRLAGLDHLLQTRRLALAQRQQRQEQRITDEFASLRYLQRRHTPLTGDTL